jgi:hypothetical protein
MFKKNTLFYKRCSNVQLTFNFEGKKVFRSREMSITIVFSIKIYLSLDEKKLKIDRQNHAPIWSMSKTLRKTTSVLSRF